MAHPEKPQPSEIARQRAAHAVAAASGALPAALDLTLSEALVLGLLKQGVKTFLAVFGHGSTEIGEVLRIYQEAGLVRVVGVRSEIEASHAAAALRWATGEKAAVITSIGPGALQALAASLVPASDGIGVWYLLGDETTEDEGYNMQQIPRPEQSLFLRLFGQMGSTYSLHTPLSLGTALRRGSAAVDHPSRPGPFFLLLPMNTQAAWMPDFHTRELPLASAVSLPAAEGEYAEAARWIAGAGGILVKAGGGARNCGREITAFLEKSSAVLVHTPIASGCIPSSHPRNMGVGGSKGSISGNFAMENADLLVVVGSRAVCQSDCSRTGYPQVQRVINLNADFQDAYHYSDTLALVGDAAKTLQRLTALLPPPDARKQAWLGRCTAARLEWEEFKRARIANPVLPDSYWGCPALTQPAAIYTAASWAKANHATIFLDAGDVQANAFQIMDVDTPHQVFTESGASYMGFAVSALLATTVSRQPFKGLAITGDGSFTMNPQILIDGAQHGAQGCILILDNGRMGAITGLQKDQYGAEFATSNSLHVDYLCWARSVPGVLALSGGNTPEALYAALEQAGQHQGLSLIHLPVYYGEDPLGGMGVYGRWNVGPWSDAVQALRHQTAL